MNVQKIKLELLVAEHPRSPQWPKLRRDFLKANPTCAFCGGKKKLEAHHIRPYHIRPELELNTSNLIPLCEGRTGLNCHLIAGHWGDFVDKYNLQIEGDAKDWIKRLEKK